MSSSHSAGSPSQGGPADPGGTYFLGRYRVVDEIGVGGMASVHLARMDGPGGFQKWVAIKKIHSHLVEDESFVQMFLDEARVAARISHPNVATVFDLGKHDATYWIAMEYLHGEPLREVMRRTEELGTAMPPEIACRVIADAAEGLHAAHELLGKNGEKLGLVHRDVTPHNLFVTYDGVTKVVDFGIAKFSSRVSQTRAGTLKGKLAYMSPEQVQGEGIDRRTDIFALGVVLWELTTGQRLFRMDSDIDTLAKVQECNVPRPSTLIRGYPIDLEKIVMKTLAKNRGERFRTARELSRALQSLLMRRGLFIASDEVAAYTQSIFADRIQKREAHLRWASEVTQTINVDQLTAPPDLGEFTNSEVHPSAPAIPAAAVAAPRPGPVRPAAGAAPYPRPTPSEPFRPAGPPRPAAGVPAEPQWTPDVEAPTNISLPLAEESPRGMTPPTMLAARGRPLADDSDRHDIAVIDDDALEEDGDATLVTVAPDVVNGGFPAPPHPMRPEGFGPAGQPMSPGGPHYGGAMGGPHEGYAPPRTTGEVPYVDPQGLGVPNSQGYGYPAQPQDPFGAPMQQSPSGHLRMGSPPTRGGRDNRTMLAQRFRRRPPMWIVAAFSCSFALFIAGVVIAILSATTPQQPRARGAGSASPLASGGPGPFTAARTAFNTVISSAPVPTTPPAAPTTTPTTGNVVVPAATTAALTATATATASAPAVTAPVTAPTNVAPPTTNVAPTQQRTTPVAVPIPQPVAVPTSKKSSAQGALTVVCFGSKCDQIIDNGTPLGPGNLFNRPVAAGRHLLVLSAQNGVKKTIPVVVNPDQTSEVRITMDK
jgi:serine/threonine-protein kinase